MNGLWIISMIFALSSQLVATYCCKLEVHLSSKRIEGLAMLSVYILLYILKSDTTNTADSTWEIFLYDIL